MNDLVKSIKVYQEINGVNDSQLSELLGLDPSTWSKIKSGERQPGLKFLRGLARIPELEVLVYTNLSITPEKSQSLIQKLLNKVLGRK